MPDILHGKNARHFTPQSPPRALTPREPFNSENACLIIQQKFTLASTSCPGYEALLYRVTFFPIWVSGAWGVQEKFVGQIVLYSSTIYKTNAHSGKLIFILYEQLSGHLLGETRRTADVGCREGWVNSVISHKNEYPEKWFSNCLISNYKSHSFLLTKLGIWMNLFLIPSSARSLNSLMWYKYKIKMCKPNLKVIDGVILPW